MTHETITVDGHEIELSNLDKALFPESGVTKGDLVDYYRRIAETALPYFRDRPLTMQRFPDGIGHEGFFQKDIPDYFPSWIGRVRMKKEGGRLTYVVANDAATLVYLANQACITPHLALARSRKPNHPDRLIFDLDPSDDDFGKVRAAAHAVRTVLEELELESCVQTTGSRGLHVLVPLDRSSRFEAVRDFAHSVAGGVARRHPELLTIEQRKVKRGDRVFVDYLRNAFGQTSVAPYGVRAREHAPIATPLRWDEVEDPALTPRKYTIANIFRRLGQIGDPWSSVAATRQSIATAKRKLGRS